jgi:hypothetical protein
MRLSVARLRPPVLTSSLASCRQLHLRPARASLFPSPPLFDCVALLSPVRNSPSSSTISLPKSKTSNVESSALRCANGIPPERLSSALSGTTAISPRLSLVATLAFVARPIPLARTPPYSRPNQHPGRFMHVLAHRNHPFVHSANQLCRRTSRFQARRAAVLVKRVGSDGLRRE